MDADEQDIPIMHAPIDISRDTESDFGGKSNNQQEIES
jgi:hypothetical protein